MEEQYSSEHSTTLLNKARQELYHRCGIVNTEGETTTYELDKERLFHLISEMRLNFQGELTLDLEHQVQGASRQAIPDISPDQFEASSFDLTSTNFETFEESHSDVNNASICKSSSDKSSSEVAYNRQKGLVTKSINYFRDNCQNPNFSQARWKQVQQTLENQLHQMEQNCLDLMNLPTLTFVEAIDIRRDFERRKADGNFILCLLQDQLRHFHLDSFSSSSSNCAQSSTPKLSNSKSKNRKLRKKRQFLHPGNPDWKKQAFQAAHNFQRQLKTETFFRRRKSDFELSSRTVSTSDLISSEMNGSPTSTNFALSTSCQSLTFPSSSLESMEESITAPRLKSHEENVRPIAHSDSARVTLGQRRLAPTPLPRTLYLPVSAIPDSLHHTPDW